MGREELKKSLQEAIAQTEQNLADVVERLLFDYGAALTLRKDVQSLRGSLEAISRNNGHVYTAEPVKTAADFILNLSDGQVVIGEIKRSRPVTKQGIIRRGVRAHPHLKIRELWEQIKADKPPIDLTMDDMHKIVARMKSKGHIDRDEHGGIYLTGKAPKD